MDLKRHISSWSTFRQKLCCQHSSKIPVLAQQRMTFHCTETADFCAPSFNNKTGKGHILPQQYSNCQTDFTKPKYPHQTFKQSNLSPHNCLSLAANLAHLPFKTTNCLPPLWVKLQGKANLIILCH